MLNLAKETADIFSNLKTPSENDGIVNALWGKTKRPERGDLIAFEDNDFLTMGIHECAKLR